LDSTVLLLDMVTAWWLPELGGHRTSISKFNVQRKPQLSTQPLLKQLPLTFCDLCYTLAIPALGSGSH
jgi:hypothetical protein